KTAYEIPDTIGNLDAAHKEIAGCVAWPGMREALIVSRANAVLAEAGTDGRHVADVYIAISAHVVVRGCRRHGLAKVGADERDIGDVDVLVGVDVAQAGVGISGQRRRRGPSFHCDGISLGELPPRVPLAAIGGS